MRALTVVALLCSALPASALDPWTWTDTAVEAAYLSLHVVDWGQTNDIAAPAAWHQCPGGGAWRPAKTYHERTPVLGRNPSRDRIAAYFIGTGLLHIGLARVLPGRWRTAFQVGTVGLEGFVTYRNARLGFVVRF